MIYYNNSFQDIQYPLGPNTKDWVTIPSKHTLITSDVDKRQLLIRPYRDGDEAYDISVTHRVMPS